MPYKPPPDAPDWFLERDCSYTENLNYQGWRDAFDKRGFYYLEFEPEEAKSHTDNIPLYSRKLFKTKKEYWERYLDRTGPPNDTSALTQPILVASEIVDYEEAKLDSDGPVGKPADRHSAFAANSAAQP